jgi:hypothetical protein
VISLTVAGQKELREVSERLKRGQGTLRKELTKAFRYAGKETLERVKNNARTMAIRGRRKGGRPFTAHMPGTNIRARIARVTELEVSTGGGDPRVKFVVRSDRLGDARNLPFHFDSGRVFRHPIMGNREAWAGQSGQPWFYNEIKKDLDLFAAKCEDAIDRTIQQIEGN